MNILRNLLQIITTKYEMEIMAIQKYHLVCQIVFIGSRSDDAVSYTHLDVYKRQSVHRVIMHCQNPDI